MRFSCFISLDSERPLDVCLCRLASFEIVDTAVSSFWYSNGCMMSSFLSILYSNRRVGAYEDLFGAMKVMGDCSFSYILGDYFGVFSLSAPAC